MVNKDYRLKIADLGYFICSDGVIQHQGTEIARIGEEAVELKYDVHNPQGIRKAVQLRYSLMRHGIPITEPENPRLEEIRDNLTEQIDILRAARKSLANILWRAYGM